jgi:hypothetical protein
LRALMSRTMSVMPIFSPLTGSRARVGRDSSQISAPSLRIGSVFDRSGAPETRPLTRSWLSDHDLIEVVGVHHVDGAHADHLLGRVAQHFRTRRRDVAHDARPGRCGRPCPESVLGQQAIARLAARRRLAGPRHVVQDMAALPLEGGHGQADEDRHGQKQLQDQRLLRPALDQMQRADAGHGRQNGDGRHQGGPYDPADHFLPPGDQQHHRRNEEQDRVARLQEHPARGDQQQCDGQHAVAGQRPLAQIAPRLAQDQQAGRQGQHAQDVAQHPDGQIAPQVSAPGGGVIEGGRRAADGRDQEAGQADEGDHVARAAQVDMTTQHTPDRPGARPDLEDVAGRQDEVDGDRVARVQAGHQTAGHRRAQHPEPATGVDREQASDHEAVRQPDRSHLIVGAGYFDAEIAQQGVAQARDERGGGRSRDISTSADYARFWIDHGSCNARQESGRLHVISFRRRGDQSNLGDD